MSSMIFGSTSSPFTALYIRDRNAREQGSQFPMGMRAITNNHYMDDYLDSVDTAEEAIQVIQEVAQIHTRAGFEMRGWTSNSQTVRETVPKENLSLNTISLTLDQLSDEKTLGLVWDPLCDTLGFNNSPTKIPKEFFENKKSPLSVRCCESQCLYSIHSGSSIRSQSGVRYYYKTFGVAEFLGTNISKIKNFLNGNAVSVSFTS